MTEFDKEIVKAAEALCDSILPGSIFDGRLVDVMEAVAAKREHERPKLLTTEEALVLYYDTPSSPRAFVGDPRLKAMQAVLDEERRRTLAVIEALPVTQWDGHATVRLDAIRAALQPKS